tara:strand:+ start:7518 stop:9035 length:1518 start_codon:yes stop_codon:yes gene_type:complete
MNTKKRLIKKKRIQYKGGGLWANIHAKRKRIKDGSGEHMRTPGSKGAPTNEALKRSQETGGLRRLYNTGGQYDNNTVSAAGQGNPSTTIIANESNPELLRTREAAFNQLKTDQTNNMDVVNQEIANEAAQGEANIANAAAAGNAKVEGYAQGVKTTAEGIKKLNPDAFSKMGNKLKGTMANMARNREVRQVLKGTDKALDAAKQLQKTNPIAKAANAEMVSRTGKMLDMGINPLKDTPGLKVPTLGQSLSKSAPGMDLGLSKVKETSSLFKDAPDASKLFGSGKDTLMGTKSASELRNLSGVTSGGGSLLSSAGSEVAKKGLSSAMGWGSKGLMSTTGVGAAGVGTGLAKFATSGAGIGTIASLAGKGVTALANDNDATTMNTGEGIGAGLSGAGAGIGAVATAGALMGSTVPVVGTLIGAGVGALYGVGKAMFARNKARKEKTKMDTEVRNKAKKYNTELGENYAQQKGRMMALQTKIKEQSGSDTGNVTVARFGGHRLRRATV